MPLPMQVLWNPVSMFNGLTRLQGPERLIQTMKTLRDQHGANAIQFYDNNFFDREETDIPILEAMGTVRMPWWCFARADALANASTSTWEKIRRSNLKMAFIGADAVSDEVLIKMRKREPGWSTRWRSRKRECGSTA